MEVIGIMTLKTTFNINVNENVVNMFAQTLRCNLYDTVKKIPPKDSPVDLILK